VREQAVDETVLAALADDASDYPETLLQVAKLIPASRVSPSGWSGSSRRKANWRTASATCSREPYPRTARMGSAAAWPWRCLPLRCFPWVGPGGCGLRNLTRLAITGNNVRAAGIAIFREQVKEFDDRIAKAEAGLDEMRRTNGASASGGHEDISAAQICGEPD